MIFYIKNINKSDISIFMYIKVEGAQVNKNRKKPLFKINKYNKKQYNKMKKEKIEKVRVCLNIDQTLHERIKTFCLLKGQSISSFFEQEIRLLEAPDIKELDDFFKNDIEG